MRPFWNKELSNHFMLKIAKSQGYVLIGLLFYLIQIKMDDYPWKLEMSIMFNSIAPIKHTVKSRAVARLGQQHVSVSSTPKKVKSLNSSTSWLVATPYFIQSNRSDIIPKSSKMQDLQEFQSDFSQSLLMKIQDPQEL